MDFIKTTKGDILTLNNMEEMEASTPSTIKPIIFRLIKHSFTKGIILPLPHKHLSTKGITLPLPHKHLSTKGIILPLFQTPV